MRGRGGTGFEGVGCVGEQVVPDCSVHFACVCVRSLTR